MQLCHGVWADFGDVMPVSDLADWEIAALVQPVLGPGCAVAGLSAASMLGIPLLHGTGWLDHVLMESSATRPIPKGPLLAVPQGSQNRGSKDLILRQRRRPVADQPGTWSCVVTGVLETLLALQEWLIGWRSVVAVEHVLTHAVDSLGHPSPMLPEQLDALLATVPAGSRGKARLRLAVARARPHARSPMETVLRLTAVAHGLPEPIYNYRVQLSNGRVVYLDLAWPHLKKAMEYNGQIHHQNWQQYRDEISRFNDVHDDGWDVRFVVIDDLKVPSRLEALLRWARTR